MEPLMNRLVSAGSPGDNETLHADLVLGGWCQFGLVLLATQPTLLRPILGQGANSALVDSVFPAQALEFLSYPSSSHLGAPLPTASIPSASASILRQPLDQTCHRLADGHRGEFLTFEVSPISLHVRTEVEIARNIPLARMVCE
jgi:hypothetical protein